MTFKALFAATATAALMLALPANAAELTVGFSQIGSESGWRAAQMSGCRRLSSGARASSWSSGRSTSRDGRRPSTSTSTSPR